MLSTINSKLAEDQETTCNGAMIPIRFFISKIQSHNTSRMRQYPISYYVGFRIENMSLKYQLFDILLAGIIAGLSTFMISFVAFEAALAIGLALASMYYFSRYPWGSQNGEEYNDIIDKFYENHFPF